MKKLQIWLKSDTQTPVVVPEDLRRQTFDINALLCNNQYFCTAYSDMQLNKTHAHTQKTLLRSHANAPQCYVTRTLPKLLSL